MTIMGDGRHQHRSCEHRSLAYCVVCDVVYCKNCIREWVNQFQFQPYWYPTTTTNPFNILASDSVDVSQPFVATLDSWHTSSGEHLDH